MVSVFSQKAINRIVYNGRFSHLPKLMVLFITWKSIHVHRLNYLFTELVIQTLLEWVTQSVTHTHGHWALRHSVSELLSQSFIHTVIELLRHSDIPPVSYSVIQTLHQWATRSVTQTLCRWATQSFRLSASELLGQSLRRFVSELLSHSDTR